MLFSTEQIGHFPKKAFKKNIFLSQLFSDRKKFVPGQLNWEHPVIKDEHSTHDFCFGNFLFANCFRGKVIDFFYSIKARKRTFFFY